MNWKGGTLEDALHGSKRSVASNILTMFLVEQMSYSISQGYRSRQNTAQFLLDRCSVSAKVLVWTKYRTFLLQNRYSMDAGLVDRF